MYYTPGEHIGVARVSADERGIIYLTIKKPASSITETIPLDAFLEGIYATLYRLYFKADEYKAL